MRNENALAVIGAGRKFRDTRILNRERIILQHLAIVVVAKALELQKAVKRSEKVVPQSAAEGSLEGEAGNALATAQQLVQRNPELPVRITGECILRGDAPDT